MTFATRIRKLLTATKRSLSLEGEGIATPIADPSEDVLRRELERLASTGPSFLALVASDGSYLQAAGNAKRMIIEGHFVGAEGITHVVLGRQGPPGPFREIASTTGPISVHQSEVWAAPEAAQLFATFAATGTIPTGLTRRDITAEVTRSQPPEGGGDA